MSARGKRAPSGTASGRGARAGRATAWIAANTVPLVLLPLAAVLLWVGLWRIWLPPAGSRAATTRTVTTVDADAATRPTHKVTTVVREAEGAEPSRRSEVLALALVLLATGATLVAVFHRRLGSIELDKDGLKIELTPAEARGAATLVGRLAAAGAGTRAYGRSLDRYLGTIAERRRGGAGPRAVSASPARAPGLAVDEANALAEQIADAALQASRS